MPVRTVIIIDNGVVQIDMIPENDADKAALRMIPAGAMLNVGKATGYATCQGGYLRPFGQDDAVQFTFATTIDRAAYVYQETAHEPKDPTP